MASRAVLEHIALTADRRPHQRDLRFLSSVPADQRTAKSGFCGWWAANPGCPWVAKVLFTILPIVPASVTA